MTYEYIFEFLNTYLRKYSFRQYNLYNDSEYELYTDKFENRRFHTMIYYIDKELENDKSSKSILIGAIPLKGIATPITKSYHYKLYNGCLISCKPFKWSDNEFYNKVIYFLVDVKSMFSFQEFIRTQDDDIGIMIDHIWYSSENIGLHYHLNSINLRYEGREDLFEKPMKNIFYLSDVPKDIMTKKETISVKI
jgi:hypothetical protein